MVIRILNVVAGLNNDIPHETDKLLCCPRCRNTTFIHTKDGFECLACEEVSNVEDMPSGNTYVSL